MNLIELCEQLDDNINNARKLLLDYGSSDWLDIIKNIKVTDCNYNKYYKLLVHKNSIADVYLIVWFNSAETPIHNHPDKGCVMKVLCGKLKEDVYENNENNNNIKMLKTNYLNVDDIGYKCGNIILHKIIAKEYSVSLHIYMPPDFIQSIY